MNLLEPNDYQKIFIRASLYDTAEKIAGYFHGKFNEVKECNPEILFIDGLEKAYNAFEQQFKREYFEQKNEYYQLIQLDPANKAEIEEPDINNHGFPSNYIDRGLYGHYWYRDVVRINEGLSHFKNSLKKIDNSQNKPLPQLTTKLTDKQRSKLFELLVDGGFISHLTDKKSFEWAFGSDKQPDVWQTIEWGKKRKNLAVYLVDNLCCDPDNTNLWSIGSQIFGINNMAQIKDGYINTNTGFPKGRNVIDEIIDKVKGAN